MSLVHFGAPALLIGCRNMGGGGPNEIFLEMSKSGRSESVLFRRAAASICMSPWMLAAEPSWTYRRNEPKSKENAKNASKSWTMSDTGAKGSFIFIIFNTCFAPKLYNESLKTTFGSRSFSSFSTPAFHQSYIRNRSKPSSESVHFHDFRQLILTKAI